MQRSGALRQATYLRPTRCTVLPCVGLDVAAGRQLHLAFQVVRADKPVERAPLQRDPPLLPLRVRVVDRPLDEVALVAEYVLCAVLHRRPDLGDRVRRRHGRVVALDGALPARRVTEHVDETGARLTAAHH